MRERNAGTLVLIGSLIGYLAPPYMSAYAVSKWGVRGLARLLQVENVDRDGVHVCHLSPGGVDTPIYLQAANYLGWVGRPPPPVVSPERVARAALRLLDHPRPRIQVGPANWLTMAALHAGARGVRPDRHPAVRGRRHRRPPGGRRRARQRAGVGARGEQAARRPGQSRSVDRSRAAGPAGPPPAAASMRRTAVARSATRDAVVIGAGPNGLVAANLLVDAGWDVLLLEAQPEVGGAVTQRRPTCADGFVHDTFSSFYPLAGGVAGDPRAAPGATTGCAGGTRPPCSATRCPTAPGRCCTATSSRPPPAWSRTPRRRRGLAGALRGLATGSGRPLIEALLTPFPPVRGGLTTLARLPRVGGLQYVRTLLEPALDHRAASASAASGPRC